MFIRIELWNDDNEVVDNYTRGFYNDEEAKQVYEKTEETLIELSINDNDS